MKRLREQIARPKNIDDAAVASRNLFAELFPQEAQPALDNATRLIISPDGPLWEVPFAALVTNTKGAPAYLGTEKAITYPQSLTLFAQSPTHPPHLTRSHATNELLVGNPFLAHSTLS